MSIKDIETIEESELDKQSELEEKNDEKELELIKTWKERCDEIARSLDVAKDNRSHWQGECNKLHKAFDAAYNKGWQSLANEAPLLELPGVDPDAWRNTLIEDAEMKESLKNKVAKHFDTLGALADWMNLDFPEKKKGIGAKVKEELVAWFDKFHESETSAEISSVQNAKEQDDDSKEKQDEEGSVEYEND